MKLRAILSAAVLSVGFSVVAAADVAGTCIFSGKAPKLPEVNMSAIKECKQKHANPVENDTSIIGEKGELANVVVSITKGLPAGKQYPAPADPAVIDQEGCMYTPHIVTAMVGQKVLVKNSDNFGHNVHVIPRKNKEMNVAMPGLDPNGKEMDSPKVPENIRIKCDIHGWMGMYLCVFDNPYFAVTDDTGAFTIPGNLPDGNYTLTAWHERYGTETAEVAIKDGKPTADIKFTFKAK